MVLNHKQLPKKKKEKIFTPPLKNKKAAFSMWLYEGGKYVMNGGSHISNYKQMYERITSRYYIYITDEKCVSLYFWVSCFT